MRYDPVMHELGNLDTLLGQKNYAPCKSLSTYIKSYTLLTGEFLCSKDSSWYILPDNCPYLIFYLSEQSGQTKSSLRVIGPRTTHIRISRRNRWLTFMLAFRPGALYSLCELTQSELVDQAVDAELLFDWCNDRLLTQLTDFAVKKDESGLISLIERELLERLGKASELNPVVQSLLNVGAFSEMNVREIAGGLGLSDRHLRNITRKYVGHSPKLILQIERFSKSLTLCNKQKEWAEIAYETGYYDQSHMIAEFQKMVGQSPDRLFS